MLAELATDQPARLVDVRQPGETAGGVIDGATVIPLTTLRERFVDLDPTLPTIVYCAGGFRSTIALSRLEREGFSAVSALPGGYGAWSNAGQPVVIPNGE